MKKLDYFMYNKISQQMFGRFVFLFPKKKKAERMTFEYDLNHFVYDSI